MLSFKSLVKFAVCAAGAGAVAAGVYYVHKRGDEERSTEAFEGTPVDEAPVQRASSGFLHSSDGHKDTQMDKATPEGSVAEAEEKKEKDEVSGVQLNSEELYVLNLEHRVMELEKLLCEAHRQSEMKSKECEQEQQAPRVLMEKYDEVKEVVKQNEELRKECEQERQAHSILKKKYDEMKEVVKKYEELLKVKAFL
ncbi:uncharacterized protein LOC128317071 isoform X1 [Pangasianodon hypophthalmus]|uniref:uncharacterized protein LOC128317071 isoform X1 n=2 Tax=Pangasianodon hypophthalmus TaxID=310915 RepID=UPI002307EB4B|nr:uncharacterized protein LOC128317071 isoform X1 [Pangasianodon hypophthalmus]